MNKLFTVVSALVSSVAVLAPSASLEAQNILHGKLRRGATMEMYLSSSWYTSMTNVRVMRGNGVARSMSVQIGPFQKGARVLRVTAGSYATVGTRYRIEGTSFGKRVALPLSFEVTSSFTSPFLASPTSKSSYVNSKLSGSLANRIPVFVEPIRKMSTYQPPVFRRGSVGDPFFTDVYNGTIPGVQIPSVYSLYGCNDLTTKPSHHDVACVYSYDPATDAAVGRTMTILGYNLPCPSRSDSVRVFLGSTELSVIYSSVSTLRVRLPKKRITNARLKLVRGSDNATCIVHDSYSVKKVYPFDFLTDSTDNTMLKSYLMALVSRRIYSIDGIAESNYKKDMTSKMEALGLETVEAVTTEARSYIADTQYYIGRNADHLVVAFCGTDLVHNDIDVETDLRTMNFKDPTTGLHVHDGFYRAMTVKVNGTNDHTVYDRVRLRAQAAVASGRKIWITGHSLGGSIAQLVAYRLEQVDGIEVAGVITFGQPMVGYINNRNKFGFATTSDFALKFDHLFGDRCERWVNFGDSIPCFFPGYVHCGTLRQFDAFGNVNDSGVQIPYPATAYGALVLHMGYWKRTYDAFQEECEGTALDFGSAWPKVDL